jgi:hypothetical protein
MTLREVLDWQRNGGWKKMGLKGSVIGKYQFIPETLERTARQAGLDLDKTKFTPAVQEQLAYTLMNNPARGKYTMDNFLKGEITAEELLDNTLTEEWMALKKTNGRNNWDGKHGNQSNTSAAVSIAALKNFRENFVATQKKTGSTDTTGLVLGLDSAPGTATGKLADEAETEFGVPGTAVRAAAANAMIRMLEADPTMADRDDLEDVMSNAKLPMAERQRVLGVRDRIRAENDANAAIQERERNDFIVTQADAFLRSGDKEALNQIKAQNPEVHSKLLALEANPPTIENPKEAEQFFADAVSPEDPDFKIKALRAYADGQIDRSTYTKVVKQYDMTQNAKEVLELPGIEAYVATVEQTIPAGHRKQFRDTLAVAIDDLREQSGGARPAVSAILAEVQNIHATVSSTVQQDLAATDAKYN